MNYNYTHHRASRAKARGNSILYSLHTMVTVIAIYSLAELVSTSQALPLFPLYSLRAVKHARPQDHHCQHGTQTKLNILYREIAATNAASTQL